jgi:hypothetical protein
MSLGIKSEGADEQCLGQSRHPGDEGMSAGKKGEERVVDDLLLADHGFADLLDQCLPSRSQLFDRGNGHGGMVGRIHGRRSGAETKDTRNRRWFQPQRFKFLELRISRT